MGIATRNFSIISSDNFNKKEKKKKKDKRLKSPSHAGDFYMKVHKDKPINNISK